MAYFQSKKFFFLLFASATLSSDIIKKTTKTGADNEDDVDYYKYKVESIPINWDQYWREPNASITVPSGSLNVSVDLPFTFPFYGHPVSKIFIFSSGFMSTYKVEHRTKYIAPMKANLDPHHDETSGLSYWFDINNSSLTVQWKNAIVRDLPSRVPFTFRAKICSSGVIEFIYQYLGINMTLLQPVDRDFMIGIGDSVTSYGLDFSYHSVKIARDMIQDKSMVTLQPLPTCPTKTTCAECIQAKLSFHCFWCPSISKCIAGIDFHRPEYETTFCPKADSEDICNAKPSYHPVELMSRSTSKTTILETSSENINIINQPTENTDTTSLSTDITYNSPPSETNTINLPASTSTSTSTSMSTGVTNMFQTSTENTKLSTSSENPNIPTDLPTTDVAFNKHFEYYNVTLVLDTVEAAKLWVDLEEKTDGRVKTSSASVGKNHAHKLKLPFPFPFFGNIKNQVSLADDGFISTMSSWMIHDKTHLIAPLKGVFSHKFKAMAAAVKYKATSRAVTVQWATTKYHSVTKYVPFLFQATLHSSGDIDFVYKNMGEMESSDKEFIGLSEGYSDQIGLGFLLLPKTNTLKYYEYHNVNLTGMKEHLFNWTAIQIRALPTCASQKTCGDCLSAEEVSGFKCGWCSTAKLCRGSNEDPGQDWVVRNCYSNMVHQLETCPKESPININDFKDMEPDDHKYYKSTVLKSKESWSKYFKDFSKLNTTLIKDLWKTSNNFLSSDPYTLSFMFPFYGHPIQDIMILSRGFISLSSALSKKTLTEHQYIAPLMAALDASHSKQAKIQIYEQDDSITISWSKMRLVLKPGLQEFSFQVTLTSNGTIIFCYQEIPDGSISEIISEDIENLHPVKIGLADSFMYEAKNVITNKTSPTLYNYHTLDLALKAKDITSNTAIILEPLPTCNTFSSCSSCLRSAPEYRCAWCPGLQFCSDGMDRRRQEWDDTRCFITNIGIRTVDQCPAEIVRVRHTYYTRAMYHQRGSLFGHYESRYMQLLEFKDPNSIHITLPFKFSYFQEEVSSLLISSHGLIGISPSEKSTPGSEQVMYKYIAPFKGELKFNKEGAIRHGEVEINGSPCYGIEWMNAQFSVNEFISFECGICANGSILFHYRNINNYAILEMANIGIDIGLWHGVAKDEVVEMAAEQVDITALKANLTMLGLVIRFSPLTKCSLSNTCLTSPECPHYSSVHGCSRLSCQEPSDPADFCPRHHQEFTTNMEHKHEDHVLHIVGIAGVLLLVAVVVGVLIYGVMRLDSRPGRWQAIHSVFQPGYAIFRSGEDIEREVLHQGEGREVEENIL